MKWFSNITTEDEAKKHYRQLARQWHPDAHIGQADYDEAEEKFKEISAEYADLIKGINSYSPPDFDEAGLQQKMVAAMNMVKNVIDELYPRTKVTYVAWVFYGFMEFGTTPLRRVMDCLDIGRRFLPDDAVYCTFQPKVRKRVAEVRYYQGAYYVDGKPEEFDRKLNVMPIYDGRRYKILKSAQWERIEDLKTCTIVYLRKSPKLHLKELYGL